MSDRNEIRRQRPAEEGIEGLYEALGGRVQRLLTRRFGVPPGEAAKLAGEIFFEYVTRSLVVDDPQECLMAMTSESGRTWQRRNGIAPPPETGAEEPSPELRRWLLLPDTLAALPEKVREMMRLRVEEQRTYEEIAAEMGVSVYYAEAAVKRAWETLRKTARLRGE